ncbi:MAG: heavy metal-binding domain-containing protein [Methanobrevibacter sp.]|jgi:uncharacterized protein YbjQ (UPF0145 family)|nr:heavy metal-binding domain-containing protein [Candidatus Methanovirga meridionalis]
MVSVDEFIVSSANFVPGYKIVEMKGLTYGLTVRTRGIGGNVSAGLRSIVGGEVGAYLKMMEESRNQAIERLIEHCKGMGGNAIISFRFDSNEIGQSLQEVLAYGTAVVVEKDDDYESSYITK